MKIPFKLLSSPWFWTLVAQFILGLFFYLVEVRPYVMSFATDGNNQESRLIAADTYTYWYHASETPFFSLPINLIGPVSLLKLFNLNFDLAFYFILVSLCLVSRELYRYTEVRVLPFAVLTFANPSIIGQIFVINKEIMIIISLLFVFVYVNSGSNKHIIAALAFTLFSKPEFLVLIIFFLVSRRLPISWRLYCLITIITLISLFYSDVPNMDSYATVLFFGQTYQSIGITVFLHELSSEYNLFFSVIVPRLVIIIYSGGILYATLFFIALIQLFLKRKWKLSNDIIYLLCLFFIMISIVPFPHYRYILPAYPLLLLIGMRPKFSF